MVATKSITIKIDGDADGLKVTVEDAESALDGLAGTSDDAGGRLGKLGELLGSVGQAAAIGFGAAGAAALGLGAAAYQLGGDFDGAYDAIRVTTGATGDMLEGLQDDFKAVVSDVPASFEDASTAVGDLNQRLGLTGPPLEALSEQFLNLARVTGDDLSGSIQTMTRVFGDWSITDQSKALDEMYRASQSTGIGIGDLAEQVVAFGAPLRGLGFGFEESIAMLGKWEKEGVNVEAVMGAMKKAYGEFSKEFGQKAPEEFRKFVAEISKAPSASAAAALAIEKLGVRNGPDFAAAVKEGRFAYGDLVESIVNGSDSINAAAGDTEDFAEKWTKFTNQMKVAVEPLASGVFGAVGSAMENLTPILNEVTVGFEVFTEAFNSGTNQVTLSGFPGFMEDLGNKTRTAYDALRLFVDVVSDSKTLDMSTISLSSDQSSGVITFADHIRDLYDTVLPALKTAWDAAFGGIETAMRWLGDHQEILTALKVEIGVGMVVAVYALTSAMVPLVIEAWSFAAAMIAATWPLLLVGAAITALIAGVIWAYNNWTFFHDAVNKVGEAVLWLWNSALVPAGEWIMGTLVPILHTVVDFLWDFIQQLAEWAGNVPQALGAVVEFFENLPGNVIGFLSQLWTTISTWVVQTAAALPPLFAGWATSFFSWVVTFIAELPGKLAYAAGFLIGWIIGTGVLLVLQLAEWTTSFLSWLGSAIAQLPGLLAQFASNLWGWMVYVVTELPVQLAGWALQFAGWALGLAMSIGGWLASTAANIAGWIGSTAAAIPGQLWAWLVQFSLWATDLAGKIPGWLGDAGSRLLDWVKGIPGYLSGAIGSMLEVGKNIVRGIIDGITALTGWAIDRAKDFAAGILNGIKSAMGIHSPSREMMRVGQYMAQGLGMGLAAEAGNLQATVDSVVGGLSVPNRAGSLSLSGGYSLSASSSGPLGGDTYQINFPNSFVGSEEQVGRAVMRAVEAAKRGGSR
jgi:phage-related minor tail protein